MIENLIYYPALPAMPSELLETEDAYDPSIITVASLVRHVNKDGVIIPNAWYERYPVGEKVSDWINKNIASDYTDIGMSLHGAPGCVSTALPHTDKTRNWTLMWILDEGGPEVDTVHWQEKNQPVIRSSDLPTPPSYDNLVEISRKRFKRGEWILLSAHVIHSLEGVSAGPRVALQIGFWDSAESIKRFKSTSMIK